MKRGNYNTKNKDLILGFLKSNSDLQFNASEIYNDILKKGKNLNLTTVYRILDKLVKNNEVLKFNSSDGKKAGYQVNDQSKHCSQHLHIQCSSCGSVAHLDCKTVDTFLKHVSQTHQVDVSCDTSMLFGICNKCNKK